MVSAQPAPDGTAYVGKEACVAFWAELMDDESTTFEVEHVFADGDWAAVRWRYRYGPTDAESVLGVNVTRVSGGRVIEQLGYTKTPGGPAAPGVTPGVPATRIPRFGGPRTERIVVLVTKRCWNSQRDLTRLPCMADAGTPAISVRGLSKHYDQVRAVDDLDLDIRDGEFFSMLGPSGSGKTTVLRLIAGFEPPTAGTIRLGDEDVTGRAPYDRDVNTVFQDYAIFPHMSVLQNVEYGLRVKKVAKAERRKRAEEALATVRLEGYAARRPHQLSGGQRQRVALARALVNRPKVLLLDEPLGALDLKLRREMQVELKEIQREVGITFVFVTHDQEEALTMSDRIAVFNEGRIQQLATPFELYEQPASAFVAGFVGTSNLLDGRVAKELVGEDGTFVIRPEKLRDARRGRRAGRRRHARPASRRAWCARSSTWAPAPTPWSSWTPAPPLTVAHQNSDRSIDAALERRQQRVVLSWRRDHLVALAGSAPDPATPSPEEEP